MNKKIVFLAFFVLILAGCLWKQNQLEKIYGTGLSSPTKFCMSEANESDSKFYECVVNLAIGVDNSSLCEEVFTESSGYEMQLKRDSCLFRAEQVGHEPGACLRIGNSTLREYCIASVSSNPERCLSLSEGDGACVLEAGSLLIAGGGSETALSCRPIRKSSCLFSVALKSGNPSACSMIERACDVGTSAPCRTDFDDCFTLLAGRSGNSSLCKNLLRPFYGTGWSAYDQETVLTRCSLRAFNSAERLASCDSLPGKERGECIAQYAVSIGSIDLCEMVGGELKGAVKFPVRYEDFAKPQSDWSAFSVSKIHDECITNLAISLKNPSLCERDFLVDGGSSLCFFETAISLNDTRLCEKIRDEKARVSCLGPA